MNRTCGFDPPWIQGARPSWDRLLDAGLGGTQREFKSPWSGLSPSGERETLKDGRPYQ